jgi:ribosomal protein S18 acetylase RimI-like enzyme
MIRAATTADIDDIARILRVSFETAMPFIPPLHTPDEDRTFIRTRVIPACEIWVADENGVIGFIAFREGWIDHLYIRPAHQRRGLGRALLEQAKKRFPELQLWAFQRNHKAIAFYEANGFRLVRQTDGAQNEEREPDALYIWSRP